jgi:hypothetical protein
MFELCIVLKRETIYKAIVGGINIQKKFSYAIAAIAAIAIIIVSVFAGLNWGGYDATPTNEPTPTSEATPEPTPIQMTEITYLLGWKNTLENYGGIYVAMNKGYYAEAGIELTLQEGFGTMQSAQVLAAGTVDFAELSGQALIVSVAKGMKLKAVSQGYQVNPTAFFTLDPTIKTPKDWEGKKVGVSPSASTYAAYIETCAKAGVDRSKVEEISTDYAQWVTMTTGKIDVTAGTYMTYFPDRNRDYEYRLASVAITQCQNVTSMWTHGYGWMQESLWSETESSLYAANFTQTRVDVTEGTCWTNEFLNLK